MAMAIGGGGGRKKRRPMSEINVTPLVDVMLVLLVIFMITAPALKEGFQVELPKASSTQSIRVQDARTITVTADGAVLRPLAASPDQKYEHLSQLVDDLKSFKDECDHGNTAAVVVINGDRKAPYERIIQVWNAVRSSGISQIAFQVEPGQAGD
jgi:biopolymer transport protein TolR